MQAPGDGQGLGLRWDASFGILGLRCELGGDAAGTCGVGLARNDHEKAFAPSSLSCLVLPARIHSPERVRPCQARIGVCNTRHAHKARPTWPGDHEALVDHRRLPCLISLPALSPWMSISTSWSSALLMPSTRSSCLLDGSPWPSSLIGPGATFTQQTRSS